MKTRNPIVGLGIAALALTPLAHALDVTEYFQLSGFGTVGAFKADDPIALVRADNRQGSGSRNDWRTDADTQLSIQATLNPNGKLRGVLQLLAKKDTFSNSNPNVEWAYLGYRPMQGVDIKVGRMVAPLYMLSAYRNVNYSQTMARPFESLYFMNSASTVDGASLNWDIDTSVGEFGFTAFTGSHELKLPPDVAIKLTGYSGLGVQWTKDSWTVRAAYSKTNVQYTAPALSAAIAATSRIPAAVCPNCASVMRDKFDTSLVSTGPALGVGFDNGKIIAGFEWINRKQSDNSYLISGGKAWYAMLGYRIDKFTPYIAIGQQLPNTDSPGLVASANAPAAVKANVEFVNKSRFQGVSSRHQQQIGVRWDFRENLAIKAQFTKYDISNAAFGTAYAISYPMPVTGGAFDGKVNTYTVNLDFLF